MNSANALSRAGICGTRNEPTRELPSSTTPFLETQRSASSQATIASSSSSLSGRGRAQARGTQSRLRSLNRVITNRYDDALRPLGMKISQLNILVAAAKFGLARPADVCELLQLDTSTLSRNVERMRAKGWLEVVPDADARAQPFRV